MSSSVWLPLLGSLEHPLRWSEASAQGQDLYVDLDADLNGVDLDLLDKIIQEAVFEFESSSRTGFRNMRVELQELAEQVETKKRRAHKNRLNELELFEVARDLGILPADRVNFSGIPTIGDNKKVKYNSPSFSSC